MEFIGALGVLLIVISALCGMVTGLSGKADWFLVARPLSRGLMRLPGRIGHNLSRIFFRWSRQASHWHLPIGWYLLIAVPIAAALYLLGITAYLLTIPGQILGAR